MPAWPSVSLSLQTECKECKASSELRMKAAALPISFTRVFTAQADSQNPTAALIWSSAAREGQGP